MDYFFKPSALKDLKKLAKAVQQRIIEKLDFYCSSSQPLKFAETLKYRDVGGYRFRIGDYRAIFDVVDQKIVILTVGHRRDIYR